MRHRIFLKTALIIIILVLHFLIVYAFETNQYPYFKKINAPISIDEPVIVNLDYQILNYMKPDGSDLRVTEDGQEIPIKVIIKPADELAHKSKILAVSSTRPDFRGVTFNSNNMIDGDYSSNGNAYFQIDSIKDTNYAWFVVEMPSTTLTDRIKIWSLNHDYSWTEIQIEGSNDNYNWNIIKSKTKYNMSDMRTIIYTPIEYKYLRFSFWHTQSLVINEIEIYGAFTAQVIFFAKSGKDYKLYYGNKQASAPSYDISLLFTKKTTPFLALEQQQHNDNYKFDSDNDNAIIDNCPTISNPDQKDTDGDGIGDLCDNCPNTANSDQKDKDDDGIGDLCDNCYLKYNPEQYDDDLNSIGYVCDDNDKDSIINLIDNCVNTYNPDQSDKDRNGVGDSCEDIDEDRIVFSRDNCINMYNPEQIDSDNDTIGDACDNCIIGYNPNQFDKNNNGIGDACEDDDKDGVQNYKDNCLNISNNDQNDADDDKIGDLCDNCPSIRNPEQIDGDKNGIGDICDDIDKDGVINPKDNCPKVNNPKQEDQNNNGIGDLCEDYDNDGVLNFEDNCLYNSNAKEYIGNEYKQRDSDKDGLGDVCDKKDDRITENRNLIWGVIIATIVVVGILAWRLSKKPLK